MKKQALFLLSCGLSLCGCSNTNDNIDDNIVEHELKIFDSNKNENSYYNEDNFNFDDNLFISNNGSCKLNKDISLPLFQSSSWEINFKNLTIKSGHLLTFNQENDSNKIYLTYNKTNKIFVIGICNNKKRINFYNYGFSLPISDFTNIDCTLKYENELFTFLIDDEVYNLNKFNVNQANNCVTNSVEQISKELRAQIIGITNSEYLYLDGVGSLTNEAHLFNGSFKEICVSYKFTKENYVDEINFLDDKSLFFLGSSIFYGHCTNGYGFVDMIKDHNVFTNVTKETVSGTTLAKTKTATNSYIERMENRINKNNGNYIVSDDALIVQLSTNDFSKGINEGKIEDETVVNSSSFDQTSITGAIEYICARARELNNEIKIIFISCPIKSSWSYRTKYKKYVDNVMPSLVEKWGINFIDLLNYNPSCDLYLKVDTSSSSGYFYDDIHPNFIGYSALMYPLINEYLFNLFK